MLNYLHSILEDLIMNNDGTLALISIEEMSNLKKKRKEEKKKEKGDLKIND